MAYDKIVDSAALDAVFSDIAGAIRAKAGTSAAIHHTGMADAIEAIPTGSAPNLQDKTITAPVSGSTNVMADSGYDGLRQVTVNKPPTEEKTVTENGVVTPSSGKLLSKVTVNVPRPVIQSGKTATLISNGQHTITPGTGFAAMDGVTVTVNVPTGGSGGGGIPSTIVAGDTVVLSSLGGAVADRSTFVQLIPNMQLTMAMPGTYRLKTIARNAHSSESYINCKAAVAFAVNGVIRQEYSLAGNNITTISEDVHLDAGDVITLYASSAHATYSVSVFGLFACINWDNGF